MTEANVLNYNWANRVGSIEKGKFGDVIAVAGNPLTDVTEMERVRFVMKGGVVMKNELPRHPCALDRSVNQILSGGQAFFRIFDERRRSIDTVNELAIWQREK